MRPRVLVPLRLSVDRSIFRQSKHRVNLLSRINAPLKTFSLTTAKCDSYQPPSVSTELQQQQHNNSLWLQVTEINNKAEMSKWAN